MEQVPHHVRGIIGVRESRLFKAHFFGQKSKVLKVDKTMMDYTTKLSDFHAQFRAIGTNIALS